MEGTIKVLNQLMAYGGCLWLLEDEIPKYFDRHELFLAKDRGMVSITPSQMPVVRIEVTFKGRRYLKYFHDAGLLRRIWLSFAGIFIHRLD